jgi:hypothetical protein
MLPHISIGEILWLQLLCVMAGGRSPQADSAVHQGYRPFEKRRETRVPARSRMSSAGTHVRSLGAGSRGERLAREPTERRGRRCGLRRTWRDARRHVRTGGVKGGDVIAVGIGILLGSSGNGSGRVMARGRDKSRMEMKCQRRF